MDEARAIQDLTSIDAIKHKRAYRRGQITKIRHRLHVFQDKTLRETKRSEVLLLKRDLQHARIDKLNRSNHGQRKTAFALAVATLRASFSFSVTASCEGGTVLCIAQLPSVHCSQFGGLIKGHPQTTGEVEDDEC